MTLPCELVQDLLPLYHDGVCSKVSKEIIKGHLDGCEDCRKALNMLDTDLDTEQELTAARPLAAVSSRWQDTMKRSLWKGVGVTVLIVALLLGCFLGLTQWKWLTISTVNMEVAEIYQLSDGRILYKLDVPEGVWSCSFDFEHCDDGTTYLIPRRSLIELSQQQGWESRLDKYLMIDVAEQNAWAKKHGGVEETKYCIGHPDEPNPLLVWEKGMVLDPAPAELEAIYG